MNSIIVLSEPQSEKAARKVSGVLSGEGFQTSLIEVPNSLTVDVTELDSVRTCAAMVAVTPEYQTNLTTHLAYLLGQKKKIWIVSDNVSKLPRLLRRITTHPSSMEGLNCLVSSIKCTLGVEVPSEDIFHDVHALLSWLQANPNRVADLSSSDLMRITQVVVAGYALRLHDRVERIEDELVFWGPERKTRVLFDCMNYSSDRRIDIGSLQETVAKALSLGCDFTVLISPNEMTRAASEYIKSCFPPIWKIDKEGLSELIRLRLGNLPCNENEVFHHYLPYKQDFISNPKVANSRHSALGSVFNVHAQMDSIANEEDRISEAMVQCSQDEFRIFIISDLDLERNREQRESIKAFVQRLEMSGVRTRCHIYDSRGSQSLRSFLTSGFTKKSLVIYIHGGGPTTEATFHILNACLSEFKKHPLSASRMCVVSEDSLWRRLSLPHLFSTECIWESSPDWRHIVGFIQKENAENR